MTLRDEFRCSMIRLDHDKARDFAESPWVPWYILAIYRTVFAVYCTGWIIYSGTLLDFSWFVYLTNWGYSVVTIYFIFASVVTLWYHYKEKNYADITTDVKMTNTQSHRSEDGKETKFEFPPKWHHKTLWVIHSIGTNIAVIVTVLYWSLFSSYVDGTGVRFGLDISNHILNCVFMLIDLALSSIPVRILHMVCPMIFGVFYGISTVIYWTIERHALYGLLDYGNKPGIAIGLSLGLLFVGIPLTQLFIYGLYSLRLVVVEKFKS
ncbi:protein rolling stone [Exaiptasia diaphana]|uniref:Protein rolling stone n=1 Tax=Exaiptasia diaphana TaxID=2652724 RepID=A0A913XPG1_EXADI|nr:protein rolling stone [Exaiptasia diaphana]KXJ25443.1 Protein rolling stone [Exaiptasia diaphana]